MTKQGGWPESGFGPRLQELREAAGLSQGDLAERCGCHQMTISKLERGAQEPAWPLVLALCAALGVPCTAFTQPAAERPPARPGRPPKAEGSAESTDQGEADTAKRSRGRPRKPGK